MSERVAIYTASRDDTRPRFLARLVDAEANLEWRTTGSRRYLAGAVTTLDPAVGRAIFAHAGTGRTAWLVWGETFIRIHTVSRNGFLTRIVCDQSIEAVAHRTERGWVSLRIVEPSPPAFTAEWEDAERARAVADYEAVTR